MTRYEKMVALKTKLNAALDDLETALEGNNTEVTELAFVNYVLLVSGATTL